jgi:hypothetical protein
MESSFAKSPKECSKYTRFGNNISSEKLLSRIAAADRIDLRAPRGLSRFAHVSRARDFAYLSAPSFARSGGSMTARVKSGIAMLSLPCRAWWSLKYFSV